MHAVAVPRRFYLFKSTAYLCGYSVLVTARPISCVSRVDLQVGRRGC